MAKIISINGKIPTVDGKAIKAVGGVENVEWHQCPQLVRDYLDEVTYNPNDYSTSQIANYAPATAVVSNTKPIGKTVDGVTYYNEVPNVATPFASANTAGTLKPLDRLRWINSQTPNMRDLGGWDCDGGTVKYGMLLRGGAPATADGTLMRGLGVRHELDLRGNEVSITSSPFGNIGYTRPETDSTFMWYRASLFDENVDINKVVWNCIVDTTGNGVPIYFHCAEGADRTATLAFLLECLLGVSRSDMDKDYELTCFSTGTDTDSHARRRNEAEWKNLQIYLDTNYSGATFQDKVANFLINKIGLSGEQINRIRQNCIDGTPTTSYHTVTTSLNHCTSNITSKMVGSSFSAVITADNGYTLVGGDIHVLMGGVDVTASAYNNGAISIASVTGDIEINITAIEYVPSYTNVFDYTTAEANYRFKSDNTLYATNGYFVTDFIACDCSSAAKELRVKNAAWASNAKILWCDSSKSILGGYMKASINVIDEGNGVYRTKVGWYEATQGDASTDHESANRSKIRYIRLALQKSSSAITQSDLADVIMTLDEVIE